MTGEIAEFKTRDQLHGDMASEVTSEMLRKYLERAERGEISAVAIAVVSSDQDMDFNSSGSLQDYPTLLGASVLLRRELEDSMLERMED